MITDTMTPDSERFPPACFRKMGPRSTLADRPLSQAQIVLYIRYALTFFRAPFVPSIIERGGGDESVYISSMTKGMPSLVIIPAAMSVKIHSSIEDVHNHPQSGPNRGLSQHLSERRDLQF